MVFLYVGLGLAMISGISAMMQIGNNINNLMFLSAYRESDYYQTSLPNYDIRIMELLNNYSGPDEDVCSTIKENLNQNLNDNLYLIGDPSPSTNKLFNQSCILVNNELSHRVLINKNELSEYNLFSCYLKDKLLRNKVKLICNFEENK